MNGAHEITPDHGSGPRLGLLWFGLLGPPLAWGAQLGLGYFLQDAGCPPASSGELWGIDVSALSAIVIVAAAAVAAAGVVTSAGALRSGGLDRDRGRPRFMAVAGLLASMLFLLAIVLSGIAFIPLDSCRAG